MAAKRTEMNVKIAEAVASFASVENVLGREQSQQMIAAMTENVTVH
jgi:hypothetical protein